MAKTTRPVNQLQESNEIKVLYWNIQKASTMLLKNLCNGLQSMKSSESTRVNTDATI